MELEGTTILVTRARGQNEQLRRPLEALGARVVEIPTIEIHEPDSWQTLDEILPRLSDYSWIVFTSTNGVSAFVRHSAGIALPRVAVVGSQTARCAEALGIEVSLIPDDYRSEGLLDAFPNDLSGVRILLPRGDIAGKDLPDALQARGAVVDSVVVYRTRVPSAGGRELREHLEAGDLDCVTFTSSSTVQNLFAMLDDADPGAWLRKPAIATIGPVTARTVEQYGLEVAIQPAASTIPDLVEAIRAHFRAGA